MELPIVSFENGKLMVADIIERLLVLKKESGGKEFDKKIRALQDACLNSMEERTGKKSPLLRKKLEEHRGKIDDAGKKSDLILKKFSGPSHLPIVRFCINSIHANTGANELVLWTMQNRIEQGMAKAKGLA